MGALLILSITLVEMNKIPSLTKLSVLFIAQKINSNVEFDLVADGLFKQLCTLSDVVVRLVAPYLHYRWVST